MAFFIGFIISIVLIIVSVIINIKPAKRYINLMDEKEINKLKNFNYKLLEIKRKRRPLNPKTLSPRCSYTEVALEINYPVPWIVAIDDIIEIYGIDKKDKFLIYKTNWSTDYAKKLKVIVDEFNIKSIDNDNIK
jgi:hypothetical protein